MKHSCK